jgi:hypothetical protein
MQWQKVPGVALGVVSKGKVIAVKGYGYANVELGVPVTSETIFQSRSVGKQFTATAVMIEWKTASWLSRTPSSSTSPMRRRAGARSRFATF